MKRLTQLETLKIQLETPLVVHYGGKPMAALQGDTVATALYANGVRIFSRSLKYHRPRGLYCLDGECSNTLMTVDGVPNIRTENTPAVNGMRVAAQNVKGGRPEFDPMGFMDKLGWAMPAGFYYRMFHRPARMWPTAAKMIRKAAGLGALAPDFDMRGRFDEIYPTADVCVVGGGPAGMRAALAAAGRGLRVVLLEARPWLGGFFDYRPAAGEADTPLFRRAAELAGRVQAAAGIRVFTHTALMGAYSDNLITAFQRGGAEDAFDQRYIEIRTQSVVAATGCIERPLLFENNERPGVMQVGCAHRLARTYGILAGETSVFSVGDDLGLEAAVDLNDLGMEVPCVADLREDGQDAALAAELARRDIPLFRGWLARRAEGRGTVNAVVLSSVNGNHSKTCECDTLVASAGLTPATGPLLLAQAKMRYDARTGFFRADRLPANMHAAGRMLGLTDARAIEASGTLAGLQAAAGCGAEAEPDLKEARSRLAGLPGPARFSKLAAAPARKAKTFLCFDEDVTLHNIDQTMAAGFDVPELAKRFSSAGTGPGQGAVPGHNLALYMNQSQASPVDTPKPTTVRPPLVPTFLATFAGANHDMSKRTALHDAQVAAGGRMERIGVWNRARRFSEDKTAREETLAVRTNVAMLDASTLGKFRLFGPDALQVLQRVYVSDMAGIAEDKVKYSAMCNPDGCVIDDGVVVRRGENEYYFTTSTGRAGATVEWLRYHTRFESWDYHLVNLTDAVGVINLAGPNARKVLQKVTDFDLSSESFPFAGYREFLIAGRMPVRAMRLGFVGELSYELHVPASYLQSLQDLLADAGAEFGIANFGLEAQNLLRLEKGHLIIGSESEQRTTLHDVGLGFLWSRAKKSPQAVGAVALAQTEKQPGRLKLVGFTMEDPESAPPRDGSVIVDRGIRGYICTARYSEALSKPVGMALVEEDLAVPDRILEIYEDGCGGELNYAKVVSMPFYDPQGTRMKS